MVHTNFFPAKNFNLISNPNLTYQKANEMALNYFFDDLNRINTAKFKIEEKLQLIPYVYSLLFSKIYSRTNNFGIRKKNNFDFHFTTWKNKKRGSIGPKILKQLPQSGANQVNCEVLSLAKDPSNYEDRTVNENKQKPINVENGKRPTMVKSINIKKQTEKRKLLEKRLNENTIAMKKLKSK